jgi:hypothetical protein
MNMSKKLFGFEISQQWDYENGFYITSHLTRVPKMLAHYELCKPSVAILKYLFDRVVSGGLVVFDDYATVSGETRAVDEFFSGQEVNIEKLPISHVPSFIRKK